MDSELVNLSQWQDLAKLDQGGIVPLPFIREIFLLECEIAGTGFVDDIKEKTNALSAGSPVSLTREPENKYDAFAIRVDNEKGEKLGYIPRKHNEILARLMDNGKMLSGKVAAAGSDEYIDWVDITVQIFMKDF